MLLEPISSSSARFDQGDGRVVDQTANAPNNPSTDPITNLESNGENSKEFGRVFVQDSTKNKAGGAEHEGELPAHSNSGCAPVSGPTTSMTGAYASD